MAKQEGQIADINHDVTDNAGMQKFPEPRLDQVGAEVQNSPYKDTVKLKKADNTRQPLGGDACDIGAASKGQGRRE